MLIMAIFLRFHEVKLVFMVGSVHGHEISQMLFEFVILKDIAFQNL